MSPIPRNLIQLTNRQQFSMIFYLIDHNKNDVKMLKAKVKPRDAVEVSQNNGHARKRKTNYTTITSFPWSVYEIDSMLPCVWSVIDHRCRQNVVKTKKWHTYRRGECHWCLRNRKLIYLSSTVMQNLDFVSDLHKMSRILPAPLVFITGYGNIENVFYCLYRT